jgi:ribosomal protein L7Ae-like RNA K-turn-binding protein
MEPVDKALNLLSLARKAGLAELGEEPVGAAARALHAHLIVVASNASDHTWRRAKSYCAGTDQICIRVNYTKDELGMATGRQELAMAAIVDAGMALSFVEGLGQPDKYQETCAVLAQKKKRKQQQQKEAKAHKKNVRFGKKK